MKLVLTGSLGHINQPLVAQLVHAGHNVTVISHQASRAEAITALGATPAIGSIDDEAFLTTTFAGADAVYLILTAAADNSDIFEAGRQQALLYARAVKTAGVKRVVNLSSVGANMGPEVGSLHIYNVIETTLTAELRDVNLTFIRPTGMYYNLFSNIASIHRDNTIYTNSSLTQRNSWVAPVDIAPVVFKALTDPEPGVTSQYVSSDEKSYDEIAAILSTALNLPVKAVQISDDDMLANMISAGAPAEFARQFVKTMAYERDNDFYADYRAHHPELGPTKLTDFASEFAAVYSQQ